MTMTPADIQAQQFPVVFRGYQVQAVDAFLDRLQEELTHVLPDRDREAATAATGADAADVEPIPEPVGPAPTPADRATADATGAAARALRTLVRAEQAAEQAVADAAAEADEIRGRAQVEAETIVAAARAESARLEGELDLRRQREVGGLVVQVQQLRAEIDRLSGLERRYREGLHALLAEQQRLLEQRLPVLDAAAAGVAPTTDDLRPAA